MSVILGLGFFHFDLLYAFHPIPGPANFQHF